MFAVDAVEGAAWATEEKERKTYICPVPVNAGLIMRNASSMQSHFVCSIADSEWEKIACECPEFHVKTYLKNPCRSPLSSVAQSAELAW